MNTFDSAFANAHPEGDSATRPLARLDGSLALSLRLGGMSLRRCGKKALRRPKLSCGPRGGQERGLAASPGARPCAPDTRPDAPAGASNYRF